MTRAGRGSTCAAALVLFCACFFGGCPETLGPVDRPEGATVCATLADCNPGVAPLCGALRACVDRRCEAVPTRTVRCP